MAPGRDWDTVSLVVVILAGGLGVFLLFGAVDLTIGAIKGKTLNPDAADLLSSILGAVVGVLATFVGLRGRGGPPS